MDRVERLKNALEFRDKALGTNVHPAILARIEANLAKLAKEMNVTVGEVIEYFHEPVVEGK